MAIPDKRADLESFGYSKLNDSQCKCGAAIEWWATPRGKKMPFFVQKDGTLIPHWSNCPNAADFRRSK